MITQIDYYFSLLSPYSYLGHVPFMQVAEKHGAAVTFKPIPIMDLFSQTGGKPLGQRHATRQAYRIMELKRARLEHDVPLTLKPAFWPYDPSLSHSVVLALIEVGENPSAFIQNAFKACWADELNMADDGVVGEMLGLAGHPAEILEAAKQVDLKAHHEANLAEAIAANVFGAPGYVWRGETFWGQDRVASLDTALSSGRKPFDPSI